MIAPIGESFVSTTFTDQTLTEAVTCRTGVCRKGIECLATTTTTGGSVGSTPDLVKLAIVRFRGESLFNLLSNFIEEGTVSAETMFKNAASANSIITWVVRFLGFLFMAFGFMAIMKPLSVLGSVIPFIGNIIGMGTGLISFVLAGAISFLVIAIAWIFVRPLLGIAMLALAIGAFIYTRKLAAASKPAAA